VYRHLFGSLRKICCTYIHIRGMQRKTDSWILQNVEWKVDNKRKYNEKAKKVINFFRDLRSQVFGKFGDYKCFSRAECLKVHTGTYFVTKKALQMWTVVLCNEIDPAVGSIQAKTGHALLIPTWMDWWFWLQLISNLTLKNWLLIPPTKIALESLASIIKLKKSSSLRAFM